MLNICNSAPMKTIKRVNIFITSKGYIYSNMIQQFHFQVHTQELAAES